MKIVSKISGQSVSQVESTRATLTPSLVLAVLTKFWFHFGCIPSDSPDTRSTHGRSSPTTCMAGQAGGGISPRAVSAPGPDLSDLHHYHLKEHYGVTPSPYQILRYSRMFPPPPPPPPPPPQNHKTSRTSAKYSTFPAPN